MAEFEELPLELLVLILSFVDHKTLIACRLLCKQWRDLIDEDVWEEKLHTGKRLVGRPRSVPWWVSFWLAERGAFLTNIVRNGSGHQGFKHWTDPAGKELKAKTGYGSYWEVESVPHGCPPPPSSGGCFVSSFNWCVKQQIVTLSEVGLSPRIMDLIQPGFDFSDWISSRFDCGGQYRLMIVLLDRDHRHVLEERFEYRLDALSEWYNVRIPISSRYGRGVRYVLIRHEGKDTQFWAGHYGIKITGTSLIPTYPDCLDNEDLFALEDEDTHQNHSLPNCQI